MDVRTPASIWPEKICGILEIPESRTRATGREEGEFTGTSPRADRFGVVGQLAQPWLVMKARIGWRAPSGLIQK